MKHATLIVLLTATALLVTIPAGSRAQDGQYKKISYNGESALHAEINVGFGKFILKRSKTGQLLTVREKFENDSENEERDQNNVVVEYSVSDGIGYLTVNLNLEDDESDINALACLMGGKESRTYFITVTDRIPLHFDFTLGAGEATLDLSSLRLRSLDIESGAGNLRIKVAHPNPEIINSVSVAAGIGSLNSEKLGNLNFRQFDFEGGIGEYRLDYSGALRDGANISTDVGIGSLLLVFPKTVGVHATANNSWMNSTEMHHFKDVGDDEFVSRNFKTADKHVRLDMESGIGAIEVKWKKQK